MWHVTFYVLYIKLSSYQDQVEIFFLKFDDLLDETEYREVDIS